jgi:hypothetical protein
LIKTKIPEKVEKGSKRRGKKIEDLRKPREAKGGLAEGDEKEKKITKEELDKLKTKEKEKKD